MVSKKVVITNPTGLHLRPAGLFCQTALEFACKITFRHNNSEGNAKSVLSVLGALKKAMRLKSYVTEKTRKMRLRR